MGLGPHSGIGGEQRCQIECVDRRVDGAGEMVGGQRVLDVEPFRRLTIPGRWGEAIEVGIIPGRRRADRREEIQGATRRIQPTRVLRSRRREDHDSRAPFVEGAGSQSAILRRGSLYSLDPLEPAESGTISEGCGLSG
jgi:hypothetical protein